METEEADEIAKKAMNGIELDKLDESNVSYKCNCSRIKVEEALISTGIENLNDMSASKDNTEVQCHFCNKRFIFTPEDIKKLIEKQKKNNFNLEDVRYEKNFYYFNFIFSFWFCFLHWSRLTFTCRN